nr:MAG TPA: Leucophaea maderae tachykinin-related peptide [Caudoviricetes sp.]
MICCQNFINPPMSGFFGMMDFFLGELLWI